MSGLETSKANCISRIYGAGDGNRIHVRSLGEFNQTLERRQMVERSLCGVLAALREECPLSNDFAASFSGVCEQLEAPSSTRGYRLGPWHLLRNQPF
jgi:hypothetical protein